MSEEIKTLQEQENETAEPKKPASKKHVILFNGKTRYYGFRNMQRLTALRWTNALFILIGIAGFIAMIIGIGAIVLWLFLFFITFSLISVSTESWFNFMENSFMYGIALIAASIILRFLVELLFSGLEKLELKANPDGAEKYLKVRRASLKIGLINLILCAAVVFAGWLAYSAGIGSNAETIIFAILAIASFIASRIILQKIYYTVSNEIIEIRLERKENREKKQD